MAIQIIEENRKKSNFEHIADSLKGGARIASEALERHQQKKGQLAGEQAENAQAKELGFDLSNIKNPETRKLFMESGLKEKQKQNDFQREIMKEQYESQQLEKNRPKIHEALKANGFNDDEIKMFDVLPVGGQTAYIKDWIEQKNRGMKVNDQLEEDEVTTDLENEKPLMKTTDFDKGLTPKERAQRQEHRYTQNLPLFQESHKKLQGIEAEARSLETLKELSPQISEWHRLNVNPHSGEIIIPAIASPEAQLFAKTVNDFTVKAKDSFGARVSNFELDRFMTRLPTLANSSEGREAIIRQMQLINEMNAAYESSLHDVIEEHGGIRNIDFDRAESIANKKAKESIKELKSEYDSQEKFLKKEEEKINSDSRKMGEKKGSVLMEFNGQRGYVPKGEVKDALKKGAKAI